MYTPSNGKKPQKYYIFGKQYFLMTLSKMRMFSIDFITFRLFKEILWTNVCECLSIKYPQHISDAIIISDCTGVSSWSRYSI